MKDLGDDIENKLVVIFCSLHSSSLLFPFLLSSFLLSSFLIFSFLIFSYLILSSLLFSSLLQYFLLFYFSRQWRISIIFHEIENTFFRLVRTSYLFACQSVVSLNARDLHRIYLPKIEK